VALGVSEKIGTHFGAHRVRALVFLTGAADAIAEETSEGISAAGTEYGAEDVGGSHGMGRVGF
jgi:hypothetical protein